MNAAPETDRGFDEPWQVTAWVMARALSDSGLYSPQEWSKMLGAKFRARSGDSTRDYYEAVVEALEALVMQRKAASEDELSNLKRDWREAFETTPHGKPVELPKRSTDGLAVRSQPIEDRT